MTKWAQSVRVSIDKMAGICQIVRMNSQISMQLLPDTGEKEARILNAALSVFALYGYRRSSMEDIAKAAGMSRAALYQHFRNKDDILSRGVEAFFALAAQDLAAALVPARPVVEALREGCLSQTGGLAQALLDSPHGEELMSLKLGTTQDEITEGNGRLVSIWADWLAQEAGAGRITLHGAAPAEVAEAIMAGQHGQKMIASGYEDYLSRLRIFAELMARGLRP